MSDRLLDVFVPPVLGALLGGSCVGLLESLYVLGQAYGTRDYSGILQAVLLYGGVGLLAGLVLGVAALVLTLLSGRPDPSRSWTISWLLVFGGGATFVVRLIVSRDVLHGAAPGPSLSGWLLAALLVFSVAFYLVTRNALKKTFFGFLLEPWGTGAVYGGLVAFTLFFALGTMIDNRAKDDVAPRPVAQSLRDRPNLLLVVVQDLRLQDLDPEELDRIAPTLARLSRESLRFREAASHAAFSRESLASVLSSQVPCAHGARGPSGALPESVDTVAEMLGRHGYTTGAVITDVNTSASFNFAQGFDTFRFLRPRWLLRASEASYRLALHQLLHSVWTGEGAERVYRDAPQVAEAGIDWLRRHGGERWFLTLQLRDPGEPLVAHPELARLVAEPLAQAAGGGGTASVDRDALYRGELAWLDRGLGELVAYLDEHDLLDSTAVVLTGLQGPSGNELSEGRLRAPLWLRLPDADADDGRDVHDLVGHVDIAPTLAALAGAPEGAGWQGASLLREYALRTEEQQTVWFEGRRGGVGLRTADWKLVRRGAPEAPRWDLFFLPEDPTAAEDLSNQEAAAWKLDGLRDELIRREGSVCEPDSGVDRRRIRRGGPSAEDCEVLRRLGYEEGWSPTCTALLSP